MGLIDDIVFVLVCLFSQSTHYYYYLINVPRLFVSKILLHILILQVFNFHEQAFQLQIRNHSNNGTIQLKQNCFYQQLIYSITLFHAADISFFRVVVKRSCQLKEINQSCFAVLLHFAFLFILKRPVRYSLVFLYKLNKHLFRLAQFTVWLREDNFVNAGLKLGLFGLHFTVPSVLDGVISSSWKVVGNHRPFISIGLDSQCEDPFLINCPVLFPHSLPQMIVPSFSALFPASILKIIGNAGPIFSSPRSDKIFQKIVFLSRPDSFVALLHKGRKWFSFRAVSVWSGILFFLLKLFNKMRIQFIWSLKVLIQV